MKHSLISLGIGILSTVISAGIAYLIGGDILVKTVESVISMILFGAAIILSGILQTGPRASSTFYMEDAPTRAKRNKSMSIFVMMGIPHLLLTFLLYA
ncbi:DUF5316 family protein [Paenibacillus sp. 1001270B_150601_E10]|uniref:DUF5316 family protein n=1 Tax=Paenibacillus sp. 1001270B_150601_E10 TaxID=2787079 RepID=UPI00189C9E7E|nr:DUF5316 family protein [Paenibacillus sp. 1001270B_150601_E10]